MTYTKILVAKHNFTGLTLISNLLSDPVAGIIPQENWFTHQDIKWMLKACNIGENLKEYHFSTVYLNITFSFLCIFAYIISFYTLHSCSVLGLWFFKYVFLQLDEIFKIYIYEAG